MSHFTPQAWKALIEVLEDYEKSVETKILSFDLPVPSREESTLNLALLQKKRRWIRQELIPLVEKLKPEMKE